MKCKNRKRCGFYLAFGYCAKAIGENCQDYKAGDKVVENCPDYKAGDKE